MFFWISLYLILAGGILYFLLWSIFISMRQKKAWQAFAKKHKLRFKKNKILDTPKFDGIMNEYSVSGFPCEHLQDSQYTTRKLSGFEVTLKSPPPFDFVLANKPYVFLAEELDLKKEIKPKHTGWRDDSYAATENQNLLKIYLTEERLDLLLKLMKAKHGCVMLIHYNGMFLLRFDTPYPFDNQRQLEKHVLRLIELAKAFDVDKRELNALKSKRRAQEGGNEIVIDVDQEHELITGLALEEDEATTVSIEQETPVKKEK